MTYQSSTSHVFTWCEFTGQSSQRNAKLFAWAHVYGLVHSMDEKCSVTGPLVESSCQLFWSVFVARMMALLCVWRSVRVNRMWTGEFSSTGDFKPLISDCAVLYSVSRCQIHCLLCVKRFPVRSNLPDYWVPCWLQFTSFLFKQTISNNFCNCEKYSNMITESISCHLKEVFNLYIIYIYFFLRIN